MFKSNINTLIIYHRAVREVVRKLLPMATSIAEILEKPLIIKLGFNFYFNFYIS